MNKFHESLLEYGKILKGWMLKGGLSILDQSISSGASFLLSVLLGRWFGVHEYGIFAFAMAFLSLFYQVQNAVIMEPMSVIGPSTYPDAIDPYLSQQRKIHFWIFIPLGLIIAIGAVIYGALGGESDLRNILILLGVLAALIQLPWMIRRSFYVVHQPGRAAFYSLIYTVILLGSLFWFHIQGWLSTTISLVLMSGAGLLAVLVILNQIRRRGSSNHPPQLRQIWRQNWGYGKWMLLVGAMFALAVQVPIYLSGLLINTDASGVIKAMQNFMQPMAISIAAITALIIPMLSKDFGKGEFSNIRRKQKAMTLILVVLAVAYELLLVIFAVPLELFLYNGKYAEYVQLIPLWGLIPIFTAVQAGSSAMIRAFQKPRRILFVAISWCLVSLFSGFFLIREWGVMGATISAVIGYAIASAAYIIIASRLDPVSKKYVEEES